MAKNKSIEASKSTKLTASGTDNATKMSTKRGKTPKSPKNPYSPSSNTSQADSLLTEDLSTFTANMKNLPDFIQRCKELYPKPRKKTLLAQHCRMVDMVVLTILSVLSGALPKYQFFYRGQFYYAPLMTVVVAMAGIGKGVMEPIFELITPLHRMFRAKFQAMWDEYCEQQRKMKNLTPKQRKENNEETLQAPDQLYFRIPTDSTYPAFMKGLSIMDGMGEILDTEIDSILTAFKNDMGNYSVFLRKNFKHEGHSYTRKTDNEYREIPEPKFAMVLSGTLNQMEQFVSEVLSGLFSRFCIYWNKSQPEWIDEEMPSDNPVDEKTIYRELGEKVLTMFNVLNSRTISVKFKLTEKQLDKFNKNFSKLHLNYTALEGEDIHATVVRMAVIFHRIAMVLSISRLLDKTETEMSAALEHDIVCNNHDFDNAMTITLTLMEHASAYFEHITHAKDDKLLDQENCDYDLTDSRVLEALKSLPTGKKLTTQTVIDAFVAHNIPYSTASKKLRMLCKKYVLEKVAHGVYIKSTPENYLLKTKEAKKTAKKTAKKHK